MNLSSPKDAMKYKNQKGEKATFEGVFTTRLK